MKTKVLSNPIEIPSLEEIQQMERQRSQAIESLEISDDSVKCQRCRSAVPIVGRLTKARSNDRIGILQRRLEWLEEAYLCIAAALLGLSLFALAALKRLTDGLQKKLAREGACLLFSASSSFVESSTRCFFCWWDGQYEK